MSTPNRSRLWAITASARHFFKKCLALVRGGQALAEYALLIGTIAAAVMGISVYVKRGIQASIKEMADQIGSQTDGIRSESGDRLSDRLITGKVLAKESKVDTAVAQEVEVSTGLSGTHRKNFAQDDSTTNGVLAPGGVSSHIKVIVGTPFENN